MVGRTTREVSGMFLQQEKSPFCLFHRYGYLLLCQYITDLIESLKNEGCSVYFELYITTIVLNKRKAPPSPSPLPHGQTHQVVDHGASSERHRECSVLRYVLFNCPIFFKEIFPAGSPSTQK